MTNGVTIIPNGQTLIVTALSTNPFYTDTGLSSAVTLPAVITTDTTWYCSAANANQVINFTITQPDGTALWSAQPTYVGETSSTQLRPVPTTVQLAADDSVSQFGWLWAPMSFPMWSGCGASGHVGTANRAHFFRVVGAGTISKIGVQVVIQSGNMSVGVYRNTGSGAAGLPGTRIATSGSVSVPAAGYQEIALTASVTVVPGDWIALSADNTTATFPMVSTQATALYAGLTAYQDTAHPLPSTAAATAGTNRYFGMVGVV